MNNTTNERQIIICEKQSLKFEDYLVTNLHKLETAVAS